MNKFRDTGMAISLLCLILFAYFDYRILLFLSMIALIVNMLYPKAYKPLTSIWYRFSEFAGTLVSAGILSLVFFLVVTPMGLAFRKKEKFENSYFVSVNKFITFNDIKKSF